MNLHLHLVLIVLLLSPAFATSQDKRVYDLSSIPAVLGPNLGAFELPAGLVDGVTSEFMLAAPPAVPSDVQVYVNGVEAHYGVDFYVVEGYLKFLPSSVPRLGSIVRMEYQTQFPRDLVAPPAIGTTKAIVRATLTELIKRETVDDQPLQTQTKVQALSWSKDMKHVTSSRALSLLTRRLEKNTQDLHTRNYALSHGEESGSEGLGDHLILTPYSLLLGTRSLYSLGFDATSSRPPGYPPTPTRIRSLEMLEKRINAAKSTPLSKDN